MHLTKPNYYTQYNYVSNSELSLLERTLNLKPELEGNFLAFGNLFDALITEPELIDMDNMLLTLSDGTTVAFTESDMNKAQNMKRCAYQNQMVRSLFPQLEFQKEIYIDQFLIQSDIAEFHLPVRCKLDGYAEGMGLAVDLKSTSCTSLKQFICSMDTFDYDRQAAFYMDLANVDRFLFVAVSKVERKGMHEVFLHAVQRGDEVYKSGLAKYQRLAYLYDMLVIR